ncbi:MAG TPA: ABC transporter permease subunit [Ktedonobacterales bacterium]
MTTTVPPTSAASSAPVAPTPDTNAFNQFARLVRWELFLAWRRRGMVITLSSLLLVAYTIFVLIQFIVYQSMIMYNGAPGPSHGLTFPGSVGVSGSYVAHVGVLLFIVLTGALIGSEYSYNTLRLSFARGVGRGQLLGAQIVALALIAVAVCGVFIVLGLGTAFLSAISGVSGDSVAFSGAGLLQIFIYWLALAFNLFAYALISVCIGTLSRSVAGAIAGPLVFIVVEVIASGILLGLGGPYSSPTLHTLGQVPYYFLGANMSALESYAGRTSYIIETSTANISLTHALLVSLAYVVVFIGLSYVALRRRDIVE